MKSCERSATQQKRSPLCAHPKSCDLCLADPLIKAWFPRIGFLESSYQISTLKGVGSYNEGCLLKLNLPANFQIFSMSTFSELSYNRIVPITAMMSIV